MNAISQDGGRSDAISLAMVADAPTGIGQPEDAPRRQVNSSPTTAQFLLMLAANLAAVQPREVYGTVRGGMLPCRFLRGSHRATGRTGCEAHLAMVR